MKKIVLFICLLLLVGIVKSQSVSGVEAQTVAEHFYAHVNQSRKSNATLTLYATHAISDARKSVSDKVYYYIFNDSDGGFVIVSGDRRAIPVIAYSTESKFDTVDMPDNIKTWFSFYDEQLDTLMSMPVSVAALVADEWNTYENNITAKMQKGTKAVSKLCNTYWDQGSPYNRYCPYDNNANKRTYTGCTATAMGQIMKYWNYPTSGTGSHTYTHASYGALSANFANETYQWSSMPLWSPSTSDTTIAKLLYHCGVAVNMNYGPSGSGAQTISSDTSARVAFSRYFKYQTVQGYFRSRYADSVWIAMLKTELDLSRPILYTGYSSTAGHAFVCDGYDANNYFHINWGWSGSSDGYYQISALNPPALGAGGSEGGFNTNQSALMHIVPNDTTIAPKTHEMKLYSNLYVFPTHPAEDGAMTVIVKIANFGNAAFAGSYKMDVLDNNQNYVGTVETKNNKSLNPNYYDSLTFQSNGVEGMKAGINYVKVYYKPTGTSTWLEVGAGQGGYVNLVSFTVEEGTSDLELYSNINISPSVVTRTANFTTKVTVANFGTKTFEGLVRADIYDIDMNLEQTVNSKTITLPWNRAMQVSFVSQKTDLEQGTYYMSFYYQDANGNWQPIDDGNYSNFYEFTIKADVAVEENEIGNSKIYPNPTTGKIVIDADFEGTAQVELVDLSGRILDRKSASNNNLEFDLSDKTKGMYIIRLTSDTKTFYYKVVKE